MDDALRFAFVEPEHARRGVGAIGAETVILEGDGEQRHVATAATEVDTDTGHFAFGAEGGVALAFEALGPAITFERSVQWLCRVSGAAGEGRATDGFGRVVRGDSGPGEGLELARSVWMCFGEELAFALEAVRPRGARGHGGEAVEAAVLRGAPLAVTAIVDPLLSSTFDGDGQLVRCGLELWEDEEEDARVLRAAGEVVGAVAPAMAGAGSEDAPAGGTPMHRSVAFLVCRHAGRVGVGGYELWRRESR